MTSLLSIFNSLNEDQQLNLLKCLKQKIIEAFYDKNSEKLNSNVSWKDIFYDTDTPWSLDFLERHLSYEDTEIWDYISSWYELPFDFCKRNIDHLDLDALEKIQLDIPKKWIEEQRRIHSHETNDDETN